MTKEQAIKLILKHYQDKDFSWAEYQLDKAERNSDGASYYDIVVAIFQISPSQIATTVNPKR